ncbi:MAG: thiamine-phosphate synthase family protein [Candidatus Bathyarchaeia archaeon]
MGRRTNRTKVKGAIRLRFPCELSNRHLLPIVRSLLADRLVRSHGVGQVKVAEILDVTQPAVSMYLRSSVSWRSEMEECLDEVKAVARELADDICRGRVTQIEAMRRVCSLCVWLRAGGPICKIHEDIVPTLRAETCSLCLEDLAEERRRAFGEYEVLDNVRRAVRLIENSSEFSDLIPEIGTNVVMAKAGARTVKEVVGVQGKIHVAGGWPRATGSPEFGGSTHVASAVLTAMRSDPSVRGAINLRFDWALVEICKKLGLKISFYDRAEEPDEVKRVDGRTIPWGIAEAIERAGAVPQVIYDLGDVGKEPMLFLLGSSALAVASLAIRMAGEYRKRGAKESP